VIRSAEEFVALRESEDPCEYGRAARDDASIEVWKEVILSYPEMRKWVAYNKTVPIGILEILANDSDPEVRRFVAAKRKLTIELFEYLSNDEDESVRLRVARNPKVPKHLLYKLADDDSMFVREAIRECWNDIVRVRGEGTED
jgi:hypothetical protein